MSKLDEINRNRLRTLATTYRGDARTIATLLAFWRLKGEIPGSLVSLLRISVEAFKEMIIATHPELEFTSTTDAVELLDRVGLLDLSKKRPNFHSLVQELTLESIVEEGLDPVITAVKKGEAKRGYLGPYASEQEKEKFQKALEKTTDIEVLVRREEELEEQKDELGKPPEGGIE